MASHYYRLNYFNIIFVDNSGTLHEFIKTCRSMNVIYMINIEAIKCQNCYRLPSLSSVIIVHNHVCIFLNHKNGPSASALPIVETAKIQRSSLTFGNKIGSASLDSSLGYCFHFCNSFAVLFPSTELIFNVILF